MRYLIFILATMVCGSTLKATELRLLELDKASLEYEHIQTLRDPYMPQYNTGNDTGEHWKYGAAIAWDICIVCYGPYELYWKNRVPMRATNKQVRYVAWGWDIGMPIAYWSNDPSKIEVSYRHLSEHVLESEPVEYKNDYESGRNYPLSDSFVVKFNLYRR